MTSIRIPKHIYTQAYDHMFGKRGEHFVFFLSHSTCSQNKPVFLVHDILCIPDGELTSEWGGMVLSDDGILSAINAAVKSGSCLIEAHNHGGVKPRFSRTDRAGFEDFPRYVHESLKGLPYAATVWGDSTVYGEYFMADGATGRIDSVLVYGEQLQQLVSQDSDLDKIEPYFNRQIAWFTEAGQQQLARFRVAIVGCGGTGSHMIQNLAYLGCRDFVLIDDDTVDDTSMNRVVTASIADIETPKVILGRQLIKRVAPAANVLALNMNLRSEMPSMCSRVLT